MVAHLLHHAHLTPGRGWTSPTNNTLLISFRLSRNFVNKHRLSMQIGAKRGKKCLQCVHISTELPFCIPPLVVGSKFVQLMWEISFLVVGDFLSAQAPVNRKANFFFFSKVFFCNLHFPPSLFYKPIVVKIWGIDVLRPTDLGSRQVVFQKRKEKEGKVSKKEVGRTRVYVCLNRYVLSSALKVGGGRSCTQKGWLVKSGAIRRRATKNGQEKVEICVCERERNESITRRERRGREGERGRERERERERNVCVILGKHLKWGASFPSSTERDECF